MDLTRMSFLSILTSDRRQYDEPDGIPSNLIGSAIARRPLKGFKKGKEAWRRARVSWTKKEEQLRKLTILKIWKISKKLFLAFLKFVCEMYLIR